MAIQRSVLTAAAAAAALVVAVSGYLIWSGLGIASKATEGAGTYRFELARAAEKGGEGKSIVYVRLVDVARNQPVSGAVIFETRADMGPDDMAAMTAPVRALPESQPGIYPFEIEFGPVWNKPGGWALTLAAKVQGETETVRGTVTFTLAP